MVYIRLVFASAVLARVSKFHSVLFVLASFSLAGRAFHGARGTACLAPEIATAWRAAMRGIELQRAPPCAIAVKMGRRRAVPAANACFWRYVDEVATGSFDKQCWYYCGAATGCQALDLLAQPITCLRGGVRVYRGNSPVNSYNYQVRWADRERSGFLMMLRSRVRGEASFMTLKARCVNLWVVEVWVTERCHRELVSLFRTESEQ